MTQEDLAQAVGVGAMQVSHYESGRRNPTGARLIRIAKVLGVTIDKLVRK